MTGTATWKVTIAFTRFNAKYEVVVGDKTTAKQVVMKAHKEGIWVTDPKTGDETFWGPGSVGKGTISAQVPE